MDRKRFKLVADKINESIDAYASSDEPATSHRYTVIETMLSTLRMLASPSDWDLLRLITSLEDKLHQAFIEKYENALEADTSFRKKFESAIHAVA